MNNELYIALAENSPRASFILDISSSEFLYVNPAFRSLTGNVTDADRLLTMIPEEDLVHIKKSFANFFKGSSDLNGSSPKYIELRLILADGKERWIRLAPVLVKLEPYQELIFGDAVDITPSVVNLNTFKKYANKKNSILNILAHDLLGPLGVVQTVTSVLSNKIDDQEIIKLIATAAKVNRQAIDLIRDLTRREFLETAEVVLVKSRINIAQKLKECMEEYQRSEEITKRKFNFFSSSADIFLDVDEPKFMQIINNLFTNALKFTRESGIISLRIEEQANSVLFAVEDNGVGIPQEFHSVLFDEFTKARRKGLQGEPTVGLGMSVIKTIVEWHKGRVWFDSEENKGTTVYFEIPKT